MVEKDNSCCEDYLRVYWIKTESTEIYQSCAYILCWHKLFTLISLVDVSKHFQANEMVVLHNFSFWVFDVYALDIAKDTNFKALPMFIQNVNRISFMNNQ